MKSATSDGAEAYYWQQRFGQPTRPRKSMSDPDDEQSFRRRFKVELFIVHPTMDPAAIAAALGLDGHIVHPVGARRMTRKGTLLPGTYQDTRWRHSVRYEIRDQWFANAVAELVDPLEPHRTFLRDLRSTGGRARDVLAKLVDLELDLGLASYAVPQA